jgi:hypothetical protein
LSDSIPIPLKVRPEAPNSETPEKDTFSSEPIDPMDLLLWLRAQTKPGHSSAAVVTAGQQVSIAQRLSHLRCDNATASGLLAPR